MLHVRANMERSDVDRLAMAFSSNVIIAGEGPSGTLRREATEADIPTITVEMGEAHRFQRRLIDRALTGVASVPRRVRPASGILRSLARLADDHRRRQRENLAPRGRRRYRRHETRSGRAVEGGEVICTITNPFKEEEDIVTVEAPSPASSSASSRIRSSTRGTRSVIWSASRRTRSRPSSASGRRRVRDRISETDLWTGLSSKRQPSCGCAETDGQQSVWWGLFDCRQEVGHPRGRARTDFSFVEKSPLILPIVLRTNSRMEEIKVTSIPRGLTHHMSV